MLDNQAQLLAALYCPLEEGDGPREIQSGVYQHVFTPVTALDVPCWYTVIGYAPISPERPMSKQSRAFLVVKMRRRAKRPRLQQGICHVTLTMAAGTEALLPLPLGHFSGRSISQRRRYPSARSYRKQGS